MSRQNDLMTISVDEVVQALGKYEDLPFDDTFVHVLRFASELTGISEDGLVAMMDKTGRYPGNFLEILMGSIRDALDDHHWPLEGVDLEKLAENAMNDAEFQERFRSYEGTDHLEEGSEEFQEAVWGCYDYAEENILPLMDDERKMDGNLEGGFQPHIVDSLIEELTDGTVYAVEVVPERFVDVQVREDGTVGFLGELKGRSDAFHCVFDKAMKEVPGEVRFDREAVLELVKEHLEKPLGEKLADAQKIVDSGVSKRRQEKEQGLF